MHKQLQIRPRYHGKAYHSGDMVGVFPIPSSNFAFPIYEKPHHSADETHMSATVVPAAIGTIAIKEPKGNGIGWGEIEDLYQTNGPTMVRMAYLLTGNEETAQDLVIDTLAALNGRKLEEPGKLGSYACTTLINKTRNYHRRKKVERYYQPDYEPPAESAESIALTNLQSRTVIAALMILPARQREAVALRYYSDLSEAETAAAMGLSRGAVKSHTARALAALRLILANEFTFK